VCARWLLLCAPAVVAMDHVPAGHRQAFEMATLAEVDRMSALLAS
jgi:hypothetical protein